MVADETRILLIEDDGGDAALVREMLSRPDRQPIRLAHEQTLADGLCRLEQHRFHLVLLDIGLPDSQGLDTFKRLKNAAPDIPVIVLTGMDDESLGIKLVQMGAQDYLVKGMLNGSMLSRCIRYGIERQHLVVQLEQERLRNARRLEIGRLEKIHEEAFPSTTARLMGQARLREGMPEEFESLTQTYAGLLNRAIEQAVYKADHDIARESRSLAERLGFLRATPRDLVEIHTRVTTSDKALKKIQTSTVYPVEARILLLMIMGDLASHYRIYALGAFPVQKSPPPEKESS